MTGRQSAIVSLVGAVLAAIGGLLPWASVGLIGVDGLRGGDGIIALAGGVIGALLAFPAISRSSLGLRSGITIVGILLFGLYVLEVKQILDLRESAIALGPGIWIGLLGSALMILFGWTARGESGREVPAPPDDAATKLAQLADLRDRGAITDAEYEAKKAELLARL